MHDIHVELFTADENVPHPQVWHAVAPNVLVISPALHAWQKLVFRAKKPGRHGTHAVDPGVDTAPVAHD